MLEEGERPNAKKNRNLITDYNQLINKRSKKSYKQRFTICKFVTYGGVELFVLALLYRRDFFKL